MSHTVPFLTGSKLKVTYRPELFGAYSHIGPKRREQQDDFVITHAPSANHPSLLAIFDGMGGMENGKIASQAAAITTLLYAQKILEQRSKKGRNAAVLSALEDAKNQVIEKGGDNSGTTATIVPIINATAHPFHLGDSRAYKFDPSHSKKAPGNLLTLLTPDRRTMSNWLTSYVGRWSKHPPDVVRPAKIRRGGALVLCTDGVWEKISHEKMAEILSSKSTTAQQMAKLLVEEALRNGSQDNCTALVYLNRRIPKIFRKRSR